MSDERERSMAAVPAAPSPPWKWASLWVAAIVVLGIGIFYPFEREMAPAKEVVVVDEDKKPVAGASVKQTWKHFTVEHTAHDEVQRTDNLGRVNFPRRTIRASFCSLCLGVIRNFTTTFVHAGYGPYEGIVVWFDGYGNDRNGITLTQSEELPPVLEDGIMKQKVVIRPRR